MIRLIKYNESLRDRFGYLVMEADLDYFTLERFFEESWHIEEIGQGCWILQCLYPKYGGDALAGFVAWDEWGEIYKIYVVPYYRKKGYGRLLIHAALSEIKHRCTMWVDVGNSAMIGLLFREGFYIEEVSEEEMGHQWLRLVKRL